MRGSDPIGRLRLIDVLYTGSVLFHQRVHSSFTAVSRSHEVGFGIEAHEHCPRRFASEMRWRSHRLLTAGDE